LATVATQEAAAQWLEVEGGGRVRSRSEGLSSRGSLRAGRKREGVLVEKELDLEARRRRRRHRSVCYWLRRLCPPRNRPSKRNLAPGSRALQAPSTGARGVAVCGCSLQGAASRSGGAQARVRRRRTDLRPMPLAGTCVPCSQRRMSSSCGRVACVSNPLRGEP